LHRPIAFLQYAWQSAIRTDSNCLVNKMYVYTFKFELKWWYSFWKCSAQEVHTQQMNEQRQDSFTAHLWLTRKLCDMSQRVSQTITDI